MKFRVKRTSSEALVDAHGDGWRLTGTGVVNDNHSAEYGQAVGQLEVATVEALYAFTLACGGRVIVKEPLVSGDTMPELEIYDDYRE